MSTKTPFWPQEWDEAGQAGSSNPVDINPDGSCYIQIKPGRKKFFPSNHRLSIQARLRPTLDFLKEAKKETTRGGKGVTVYYRDETGKVCLPPDPEMVPRGYDRLEASGPREQDKLAKELERDAREQFGEDHYTAFMDEQQGNPRDYLARTHAMSDYERDLIGGMLKVLDKEESDRKRIGITAYFPERERM